MLGDNIFENQTLQMKLLKSRSNIPHISVDTANYPVLITKIIDIISKNTLASNVFIELSHYRSKRYLLFQILISVITFLQPWA